MAGRHAAAVRALLQLLGRVRATRRQGGTAEGAAAGGDGRRWWGPGGERGAGVELGALAPSSARVQRVGKKGGGGRRKKGKEGEKKRKKKKKEKGKKWRERERKRESCRRDSRRRSAPRALRHSAGQRRARGTRERERGKDGDWIRVSERRIIEKRFRGNRSSDRKKIWNDLSSAMKKILKFIFGE